MAEDFLTVFSLLITETAGKLLGEWGVPEERRTAIIERPSSKEHGDIATNIAMIAAGSAGKPPRELAQELVDLFSSDNRVMGFCESIEIAGPGFINFFFSDEALAGAAAEALSAADDFGTSRKPAPEKVLLEYVSANPTGPLHAGHARYAAYGDSLRRLLKFTGDDVTPEFYINDYGSQMDMFGRSLAARYAQAHGKNAEFPQEGYKGDYTVHIAGIISSEIAGEMLDEVYPELTGKGLAYFKKRGCELVLDEIRTNLERFGVEFDNWFSEASIYERDGLAAAIEKLESGGELKREEEALWLLTSKYGDDKDRVLIRSSGEPTYFASDIAYHQDKLARGYGRLINIWGADHHGYVPRMKAAFEALSHDSGKLEIIIGQLVNVIQKGEKKQMSKRAGTMVTLSELLDSIGVDAARFYLVDRSHDSTLDLDLEKAKLKSEENPVYYVQYAHARICSIIRKAGDMQAQPDRQGSPSLAEQERELVMKILEFPIVVSTAAGNREPHKITTYARELAATFHVFYHNCPVIRAPAASAAFRYNLCLLTRNVIRTGLDLVGVSAPERM